MTDEDYHRYMKDQEELNKLIEEQGGPANLFNIPEGGYFKTTTKKRKSNG